MHEITFSDKASGVLASSFYFIRQLEEGGLFVPSKFLADLISALLIALISTFVSWAFRRFILDKIKAKNVKK